MLTDCTFALKVYSQRFWRKVLKPTHACCLGWQTTDPYYHFLNGTVYWLDVRETKHLLVSEL